MTHARGSFTDSIVYPSRRAFKVAKFSSSKQPGRYGLVAELYFHDETGWSWGCVSATDSSGRTIWVVDAHRDGRRFVVRADEKLAFLELESVIRAVVKQKLQSFSQNVWSDVAMEFAKHKNGHHPHF